MDAIAVSAIGRMYDCIWSYACAVSDHLGADRLSQHTIYHCTQAEPTIALADFVLNAGRAYRCSRTAVFLSIVLASRYSRVTQMLPTARSAHRLFSVALLVASKVHLDRPLTNATFARASGLAVRELYHLELDFVTRINFDFHVSAKELDALFDGLCVASRETLRSNLIALVSTALDLPHPVLLSKELKLRRNLTADCASSPGIGLHSVGASHTDDASVHSGAVFSGADSAASPFSRTASFVRHGHLNHAQHVLSSFNSPVQHLLISGQQHMSGSAWSAIRALRRAQGGAPVEGAEHVAASSTTIISATDDGAVVHDHSSRRNSAAETMDDGIMVLQLVTFPSLLNESAMS